MISGHTGKQTDGRTDGSQTHSPLLFEHRYRNDNGERESQA